MCNTRLDISHSVGLVRKFMEHPKTCHLIPAKRNLRYIKDTIDYAVLIPNQTHIDKKVVAYGYSDSD